MEFSSRGFLISFIFLVFTLSLVSAGFGYDNLNLPSLRQELFDGKPSSFYMPNNKTVTGNFSFDGLCVDGGVEIKNGTICATKLEIYNITSVDVTKQNVTVLDNFIIEGNITGESFIGRFYGWMNWIINLGVSQNYLDFNGTHLTFSETQLNSTIDLRTASVTYNATSISTLEGTLDSGNLASVKSIDSDFYSVSEDAGASPLLVQVNFTGVETFSNILLREQYVGGKGHKVEIQSWNYDDVAWESHGDITDQSTMVESVVDILDASDHISGGLVQIQFDHTQNGISSHDFFLDYIALQEGFTSITNAEHDSLLGRGDIDNHPWAMSTDGSVRNASNISVTEKITAGQYRGNGSQLDGVLLNTGDTATGNYTFDNNVTANTFFGDLGSPTNDYIYLRNSRLEVVNDFNDKLVFDGGQTDPHTILLRGSQGFRFYSADDGEMVKIDNSGNVTTDGNITANYFFPTRIIFTTFGEMIDNLMDGWIRITGNLLVTQNLTLQGTSNVTFWNNGTHLIID